MSDFDKEAEREKLREKYAKDEHKRKQTQRMSELLLKGATMTNRHCDRCGDPIFRYDGQEFCPTCASQDADGAEAVPDQDTEIETREMSLDSAQEAPSADATDQQSVDTADRQSADAAAAQQATDGNVEEVTPDAPNQPAPTPQSRPSARRTPPSQQSAAATTDDGTTASQSAGTGRAALQQALSNAATNAAAVEDPHTAKAWLEAAREAAEALSALDR